MLSGLGLICPGLFSHKATNLVQRSALRVAARLGLNRLHVQVPLQDPALFTNSQRAQEYVAKDPLALRKITIRFALSNLELLREATARPEEIRVPVLLILTSRDPITDNQRTKNFVGRMGSTAKRIIEYPDASHTLEFEDDPAQYFQDLAGWCREIAKTGPAPGCA
jgi:alpha-beta hydrolase superfamily lysophospholipase